MINRRLLGGRSLSHAYDAHTLAAWDFDAYDTLLLDSVSGRRLGPASLEQAYYDGEPQSDGSIIRYWPNKARLMSSAIKKFGAGGLRWCAHLALQKRNADGTVTEPVYAQSIKLAGAYADSVPAALTVDFWIYFETANLISSASSIFETNSISLNGLKFYFDKKAATVTLKYKKSFLSSNSMTASYTPDAWNHIAMTVSSSGVKFFKDGVLAGSYADAVYGGVNNSFSVLPSQLPVYQEDTSFGIYFDRLRFSDVERWTSNFTPPREWEF
ncbi:LamG-like jellyroll fold domain-containing protein [Pyramidobacter sp.]|uniref:LamG-like jellyroll fold domain-containing protein n=1 Tax=Pyramidobacter sp. TaxID=1943581 RepID=UPI003317042F